MVFTEILAIRVQKANKATPITKSIRVSALPISNKENTSTTNEIINGTRLLYLDTNHPEMGKPIKELIGMTSNKFPNSTSLKSKFDLIDGIREAHVANPNPSRKK